MGLRTRVPAAVYRRTAWPLLARMDPEDAHTFVLRLLSVAQHLPGALLILDQLFAVRDPRLMVSLFGLDFPNPVGLAAGLDKEARAPRSFAALGFGSVEVGTVTPLGQPGNPRPRIIRLPEHGALINRMGFPNGGASATRHRLLRAGSPLPGGAVLGVNLGKNALTPLEDAARDYISVLDTYHDLTGYAVVNVSSPNTTGLRDLQERRTLEALLNAVVQRRNELSSNAMRVPVLVKVAPDLDDSQVTAIVEAVSAAGVDGIIATNTTLSRDRVAGPRAREVGGLSGEPLRQRSTEIIRLLSTETGGRMPIVGVGGISHPDHALEKLDAGARLIQLYTGFIYAGPTLVAQICNAILSR